MTEPFDPKKSYLSIKAHEGILAFAGFLIGSADSDVRKEGVLKIASLEKVFGGGYLTLTFLVDTEHQAPLRERLDRMFEALTDRALRDHAGSNVERIHRVSLDALAHLEGWYIQEINVHFRKLKDNEKTLVENHLIPAMEKILPLRFQPVEWWPIAQAGDTDPAMSQDTFQSDFLKGFFRRWLK